MDIGKSVLKLRQTKKLNQKTFAALVGMNQSYLSLIESNKKKPSTSMLQKIADVNEVPLPLLMFFGLEISDVAESKRETFKTLKPLLDQLIVSLAEEKFSEENDD